MAGIGDQCSHRGVNQFTTQLINFSGAQGYCVYAYIVSKLISLQSLSNFKVNFMMSIYFFHLWFSLFFILLPEKWGMEHGIPGLCLLRNRYGKDIGLAFCKQPYPCPVVIWILWNLQTEIVCNKVIKLSGLQWSYFLVEFWRFSCLWLAETDKYRWRIWKYWARVTT